MLANTNHKILAVGLAAALLGGSVGALVSRSTGPKVPEPTANATTAPTTTPATTQQTQAQMLPTAQTTPVPQNEQTSEAALTPEQIAYRDGFAEGFRAGRSEATGTRATSSPSERVVYRNVPVRSSSSARRVYYDYNNDRRYVRYRRDNRSFWDRHRDKLTVAIGTGVGAAVGGAVGGKKGALIGALAGAGGSALYTYKLRKRDDRRY